MLSPAMASTADADGNFVANAACAAAFVTVTSAAKPDVSFDGSVAVALMNCPTATETLKTIWKLAAPLPSVVTCRLPRYFWPSPKPEGSANLFEKNWIKIDGIGGKACERAGDGRLLALADGRSQRRRLGILVAVAAKVDAQVAVAVNRVGQNGVKLSIVADRDARPSIELDDVPGAASRAADRVEARIVLNMDAILAVAQRAGAILAVPMSLPSTTICLSIAAQPDSEIGHCRRSRCRPLQSCRRWCRQPC